MRLGMHLYKSHSTYTVTYSIKVIHSWIIIHYTNNNLLMITIMIDELTDFEHTSLAASISTSTIRLLRSCSLTAIDVSFDVCSVVSNSILSSNDPSLSLSNL